MMRGIRWVLGPVALMLAGCASNSGGEGGVTELTRIGEAVQVIQNAEGTQECEFISDLALSSSSPSDAEAMRRLRNAAGDAGANLVLLVMESRTAISRAEGYLCAD